MEPVKLPRHEIDDLRPAAREAVVAGGLPELLREIAAGPYGVSEGQLRVLRAVELGLATVGAVRAAIEGRIAADRRDTADSGRRLQPSLTRPSATEPDDTSTTW